MMSSSDMHIRLLKQLVGVSQDHFFTRITIACSALQLIGHASEIKVELQNPFFQQFFGETSQELVIVVYVGAVVQAEFGISRRPPQLVQQEPATLLVDVPCSIIFQRLHQFPESLLVKNFDHLKGHGYCWKNK